ATPPLASDGPRGHRRRLRERFERSGFAGFADYEIVELLLTLAVPRGDVKPTAKALIARFGSLRAILDAPVEHLRTVSGVGEVTPIALRIIRETANLYLQQEAEARETLDSLDAVTRLWRSRLGGLTHEVFEIAYLDAGLKLLRSGIERLEDGTVDRAAVYPRKVMEAALRRGAAAIIVAHNHPSGRLTPSNEDRALTRALKQAAATLNVRLIDHLIVSADGAFSFAQTGLLDRL
ncbi:MAG: DNA repair protein RadC, partial [Dehalococcoidia bacterium]|nr:DNA repair protein RadC [Dehalococcoidia bacterium]